MGRGGADRHTRIFKMRQELPTTRQIAPTTRAEGSDWRARRSASVSHTDTARLRACWRAPYGTPVAATS
jgi:hypothetical protein